LASLFRSQFNQPFKQPFNFDTSIFMALSLGMSGGMEQTLNPKMIAFYELLQQPGVEINQAIEQELQDNPALDVSAERQCPACGATMLTEVCRECGYRLTKEDEERELAADKEIDLSIEAAPMEKPQYIGDMELDDVMARVVAPVTLGEHLRWAWRLQSTKENYKLGLALIGCIDDDGYLDNELDLLAEGLGVEIEELESVLKDVQQLDPVGVGARDLKECLKLQLENFSSRENESEEDRVLANLTLRVMEKNWDALARHSYEDIARKMKISAERIQDVADFVRTRLTPYPGRQFRPSWQSQGPGASARIRPDVEIRKIEDKPGEYEVIVQESRSLGLRVNGVYRQLWEAIRRDPAGYSSKDREHVQQYLTRAREFIDNLNQRRKTLKLIIEAVAFEQGEYLERGPHDLKPLTRLSVAHKLGLHESTVGRAVSGKFALIPAGDVIPCEIFFDASLSVKEVIKDLLMEENPRKPYSDEQISHELSKHGIEIARRTVTKYREALKIPPAAQRRRFN
jgi:RNA polymerase sigma-54 factor